jgi:hypothetical protein
VRPRPFTVLYALLAAACLASAAAWVLSYSHTGMWLVRGPGDTRYLVDSQNGALWITRGTANGPALGIAIPDPADAAVVPYAVPLALAGVPLLVLEWRRQLARRRARRAERGLCVACGYDLRASIGRCPECGQVIGTGPTLPSLAKDRHSGQRRAENEAASQTHGI